MNVFGCFLIEWKYERKDIGQSIPYRGFNKSVLTFNTKQVCRSHNITDSVRFNKST